MKPIKVCIVPQAVENPSGGVYNHCLDLVDLMKDSQLIEAKMIPRTIRIKKIPILGKYIFDPTELKSFIKKCDADIIHIHGFAVFSAIQTMRICSKLNKKFYYSPHFHPFKFLNRPWLGNLFFMFLVRPLLKKASAIITINNTDTFFFRKYHSNIFKIPHYIRELPKTEISKQKKKNIILFVGRNESNKGTDHLEKIPPEYELICVTNKPINRKNTYYFSGISREELSDLYHSASLVVVPSRYEAFSYVSLEALTCGTPVLMSDNVEIKSYLKNIQGIYSFAYGNINDFLKKIKIAINSTVAVEKINGIFAPDAIRLQYEKAFSDIKSR